jgi:hypothetical protein
LTRPSVDPNTAQRSLTPKFFKNMTELTGEQIQKFLKELMEIERRYATEQRNQKSNRQSDVKELLDAFVAKEIKHED